LKSSRNTPIYTKNGDDGRTATLSGRRVSKNDPLIHLEGELDGLNSHLGLIKAILPKGETGLFIEEIQKNLMKLMADVSRGDTEKRLFCGEETAVLEREIDRLSEKLPQDLKFVIPGKSVIEAQINIARTAARRAERLFAAEIQQRLLPEDKLPEDALIYLNRLSDYLFVLSRQDF